MSESPPPGFAPSTSGLLVPERALQQRSSLTFQQWVDLFKFDGTTYPFLQTTMATMDEETIGATLSQVARSNGLVFALMVARMQVFSQGRFQWTRFDRGVAGEMFGSPDLAILERPWRNGVTADLLARMEQDVTTAGQSYIRRIRRGGGGRGRLVRLPAQWVTIVMGSEEDAEHPNEAPDVEVIGYMYRPPNGKAKVFLADLGEIAHYAPYPDPDANFLGMSWITAAIRDVSADNLMTDHQRAFMKNAATPNLAIKFDPSITIEAVKEFKELMEAEHQGVWNAYKTIYMGGGADPVPIGKDFRQLEFAVTQGKGESRLAAVAGVPPSWVGFSEGLQGSALNAGNFTAARRRYGDGTMHHLWTNASASLESIVPPPDGANLWVATRGIPFLRMDGKDAAETQALEAQTITTLVREGFDPATVQAAVTNQDWSLLVHTGRVSVQLQTPGESAPAGNGGQGGK